MEDPAADLRNISLRCDGCENACACVCMAAGGGGENHGVSSAYAPFGDATRCARLVDGVGFKIQSEFA